MTTYTYTLSTEQIHLNDRNIATRPLTDEMRFQAIYLILWTKTYFWKPLAPCRREYAACIATKDEIKNKTHENLDGITPWRKISVVVCCCVMMTFPLQCHHPKTQE